MPLPPPRPARSEHVNGPALRAIRQLREVSTDGLAETLQCTGSYISKLENGGRHRCAPLFFRALCEALNVDPRALAALPPPSRGMQPRGVLVNGVALAAIRGLVGTRALTFAGQLHVTMRELAQIEAAAAAPCHPGLLEAAALSLGVADRRALLASPYAELADTVELPRPVGEPTGAPLAVRGPA